MLKKLFSENTAKAAIYVLFSLALFGALFFTQTARAYSAGEQAEAHGAGGAPAAPPPAESVAQRLPASASATHGGDDPADAAAPEAPDPAAAEAEPPLPEILPPLDFGPDMPDAVSLEAELERLGATGVKLPDIIEPEYLGTFYATAYCCEVYPHICGGNGVTASGTVPTPGLTAAADWRVLPPGTWLYIEGVGVRRVEDSGSAIKQQRLDIAIDTHANALRWRGLGNHEVWVLAWG